MKQESKSGNYRAAFIAVTSLFFMWGFMTCLNDVVQPILKKNFHLSHFEANLVQLSFFIAYFFCSLLYYLLSLSIGDPMIKLGYKRGLILGLLISALGCAMFYPAAQLSSFSFCLAALFTLASGFTLLQIAANPYVTLLGPPQTPSSRLNLSQAFNSFGTTIAPVTGGYLFYQLFHVDKTAAVSSLRFPYLIFAAILILTALAISMMKLPEVLTGDSMEKKPEALKHRNLQFGMLAIFFYVGAEVSIGANFLKLAEEKAMGGMQDAVASLYLAFYWGGAMIGRFLGSVMMSKNPLGRKLLLMCGQSIALVALILLLTKLPIENAWPYFLFLPLQICAFISGEGSPSRTLAIFAAVAIGLLTAALFTSGITALWLVIAVGLFNSIMWSNIFSLGIAGLGKSTSQGSSLLVMMILGGALLPPLMGIIADNHGLQISLIVPLIAYFYLLFYGISGYKPSRTA